MPGSTDNGKDFNFFAKPVVSNAAFSNVAPDLVIAFRGKTGFQIMNEGSGVVEISYNGNTVHGEFDSSKDSKTQKFDNRYVQKIWFRLKSGSACTMQVQVWNLP